MQIQKLFGGGGLEKSETPHHRFRQLSLPSIYFCATLTEISDVKLDQLL